jgi:raffinose/stachyose/melibiose transport system permease protein
LAVIYFFNQGHKMQPNILLKQIDSGDIQKRNIWQWLKGNRFRKLVLPWLFILPIILIHLTVVIYPALSGVYYSLTKWDGMKASSAVFIGLDNFRNLFLDLNFRQAFGHNLIWMVWSFTVPMSLALLAASIVSMVRRGAMLFRVVVFIPYILPSVIVASIWQSLINPQVGILAILNNLGVTSYNHNLLGMKQTSLLTVAFVDNWHWWGFLMAIFLTAMQNIPPELYEAARIDGANRWQEIKYVMIPGIRPTLFFMLTMTAIWSFLVFDYAWLLTRGGPAGSSEVLSTYIYKYAMERDEIGYGTAAGLTVTVLAGTILGIFTYLRKRGWEI